MKTFIKTLSLCIVACILCCCKNKQANNSENTDNSKLSMVTSTLKYAQGFHVKTLADGIRLIGIECAAGTREILVEMAEMEHIGAKSEVVGAWSRVAGIVVVGIVCREACVGSRKVD